MPPDTAEGVRGSSTNSHELRVLEAAARKKPDHLRKTGVALGAQDLTPPVRSAVEPVPPQMRRETIQPVP